MSNDTTTAPLPSAIPHVTRRECANALIQLSAQIVLDSASLLRFSSGILKGEPVAGRIKRYAGSLGQSRGAEVLQAAGPLIALEEAERPARSVNRRVQPEAANIARPTFAGRAS